MSALPGAAELEEAGIGLSAVVDRANLPGELAAGLGGYRQMIVFGHRGRRLWEAIRESGEPGPDPIDSASRRRVEAWIAAWLPGVRHRISYPALPGETGSVPNLGALGECLGWQHPSPLGLGIHPEWGTWFAYRAVVLADSRLPPTPRRVLAHPCERCAGKPCLAACPAGATRVTGFDVAACCAWRLALDSRCATDCPARRACPVGAAERYGEAQMTHVYAASLASLRAMRGEGG